ncbi:DNA repair protein rad10, putative [Theileria equi strain WA]|uniref:DNA repair protein rad10, putative n=1 Tax=Theileria equi strain WA TaxID=1537102 RepID=L1LFN9_THEEQ|nr:DNA repair protein rad10, putative [Theileria equi strain WA]EKX74171.1 DNA repair protein rad10, putative [Theileria equi strain WA]|eukprot:XP_004833623.1 DNA repair protein rad10, putative [Theileria equi strain WA]
MPNFNIRNDDHLIISPRQRRNPLVKCFRNITFVESDIPADFMISPEISVLFLSLKYHRLHSNYIIERIKSIRQHKIPNLFILCQVDIAEFANILNQLTVHTFTYGYKILLSWNCHESAAVIEILKLNYYKGIEILNKKETKTHFETVCDMISSVRSINSSDASLICRKFKTLKEIVHLGEDEIYSIPGCGEKKVKALTAAFKNSFY